VIAYSVHRVVHFEKLLSGVGGRIYVGDCRSGGEAEHPERPICGFFRV